MTNTNNYDQVKEYKEEEFYNIKTKKDLFYYFSITTCFWILINLMAIDIGLLKGQNYMDNYKFFIIYLGNLFVYFMFTQELKKYKEE